MDLLDGYYLVNGNYNGTVGNDSIVNGMLLVVDNTVLIGSITLNKSIIKINETINGVVNIVNTGNDKAYNVTVKLNIPSKFLPTNTSSKAFSSNDYNIVVSKGYFDFNKGVWYVDDLDIGESADLTFNGRVGDLGNYGFTIDLKGSNFNNSSESTAVEVKNSSKLIPPIPPVPPTPVPEHSHVNASAGFAMEPTGIQVIALILTIFSIVFVGFRRQDNE